MGGNGRLGWVLLCEWAVTKEGQECMEANENIECEGRGVKARCKGEVSERLRCEQEKEKLEELARESALKVAAAEAAHAQCTQVVAALQVRAT